TFMNANYYDILSPNFNSRGLKILHTQSDADGDGVGDPGFVVGGFFSDCYALDVTCTFNNIGFVMRTDFNLNHIWTTEIDANNTINNLEYDFVNGITETSDGFFITGSATGITATSNVQQAVLAHKLDFMGAILWDSSYILGNASDLSTDAYFDVASNEIYMLVNYSISHYFGVTVLNNTTGAITLSKSWYAGSGDLDRYGFRIIESATNTNNLVISGYDRDENWTSGGASFFGQSNIFVYEFVKATGVQVGASYQYLVPHTEPAGDEFNFWSGQLPLIYYPDISHLYTDTAGVSSYFHVGYRTNPSASFTEAELFRTPTFLRNECEDLPLQLTPNAATFSPTPVTSGQIPTTAVPLVLNDAAVSYTTTPCDMALNINDIEQEKGGIFPNPAADYVFFTSEGIQSFQVMDAMGRTIFNGVLTSEKSIYVGHLKPGMYFIQVEGDTYRSHTFKLVKK
ncbi:MAG: T9SS type A sorting domain-containing protein, partial [Bacteroidota bacterium]